jgi:hypothetical protein
VGDLTPPLPFPTFFAYVVWFHIAHVQRIYKGQCWQVRVIVLLVFMVGLWVLVGVVTVAVWMGSGAGYR